MKNKQRLMVIGAGPLQLPAIKKGKEMGLEVIAIDFDPKAPGFKYADKSFLISTVDIEGAVMKARELGVDAVITVATDRPMRTVAAIGKELGLNTISIETAETATNKARMRERLDLFSVPIPNYHIVSTYSDFCNYVKSCDDMQISKPADNSGSRGVCIIKHGDDLRKIYEYSSKSSLSGEVVVESYMKGPEVSVETLTVDGKTEVISITDKITTGAPNFVEMGHSIPSLLSNDIKEKIRNVAIRAVEAIGIVNGPSHTEIIVTNEGPKIVELGARLGGDNITSHLVPLATGVNMIECCINIALGKKPDLEKRINKGSAIRYIKCNEGKIISINGINEALNINGVEVLQIDKNPGDIIEQVHNSANRVGYVIAQAENLADAIKICSKALNMVEINMLINEALVEVASTVESN